MYRIMVADDEGLVLESMKKLIEKNFGNKYKVEYVRTGREVIELAETFRPDIALMDIQMPGINGIDAIEEMQKRNLSTYFIVMSAFNKFDYAKRAIDLGVIEYLTKPSNPQKIVAAIEHGMKLVEKDRNKRKNELEIKEKLEIVVPIIESGLIYTILFHDDFSNKVDNYKQLLKIEIVQGYVMVLEFGDEMKDGVLMNPIGATVKVEKNYLAVCEIIKEFFSCVVGSLMSNRIIVYVPYENEIDSYEERVKVINNARDVIRKLCHKIDVYFRIGIGNIKDLVQAKESYIEANRALRYMKGTVAHIEDLVIEDRIEENYPRNIEMNMLEMLRKGNSMQLQIEANHFFNWMIEYYSEYETDVKLKVLEMVMVMERESFSIGKMTYHFRDRRDYLGTILDIHDYEELRTWFLEKITIACEYISSCCEEEYSGVVWKAKKYINANYNKEIALDEVSQQVNISPYYFSKIFKEQTGENFIEYLTSIRIGKAKELLRNKENSIKEVCLSVGYSDPNYFSRIFKKCMGITPTEFRRYL